MLAEIWQDVRVGDSIVEINGTPAIQIKQLTELQGNIVLKLMPAPLHKGPSVSVLPSPYELKII